MRVAATTTVAATVVGVLAMLFLGVSAETSKCVIMSDGQHPTVDLNALYNAAQDREIASLSNDEYVYHLNLCGQTVFRDNTCNEGATVCEIKDSAALDVYGYVDTIDLQWVNNYLVMTMEGYPQCPFNAMHPYVTKVWFLCSHEEEAITIRTEAYYQCLLEFEYHTPLACGTGEPRYRCDETNKMCVQDDGGSFDSIGACESQCSEEPTNGRYSCTGADNYTCVENNRGVFESKEDCTKLCVPIPRRYSCFNDRCVRDSKGPFTSEMECAEQCAPAMTSRWACSDSTCTEDATGEYSSEGDCEAGCNKAAAVVTEQ